MKLLQNYPKGANRDNKFIQGPCTRNTIQTPSEAILSYFKTVIQDLWLEFLYSGSSTTGTARLGYRHSKS